MAIVVGPQLQALLDRYGLGSLTPWISESLIKGVSEEQIMLELYDRPEFKRAFPEIEARRLAAEQTGLAYTPISPEDVLNYRTQARELMRMYGLPSSFYSQDSDFFNLIVDDVSMDELNWRLETASQRVFTAPPEVRSVFGELFGAGSDDALFALFVDPDRAQPLLEDMVQRAEIGGAARRFGFDMTPLGMQRLEQYNITYQQALEGFSALDVQRGLFAETISEEEDLEALDEGVEATFGIGGGAVEKVQRRAQSRVASTKGQSGGGAEERGVTGLGGAGRR